jgi:hypothetical protein
VIVENFYYDSIYDILQDPADHAAKAVALKRLKANRIRLNSLQKMGVLLDNADPGRIVGEDLSIYHYITPPKRQKARFVNLIYDQETDTKETVSNG